MTDELDYGSSLKDRYCSKPGFSRQELCAGDSADSFSSSSSSSSSSYDDDDDDDGTRVFVSRVDGPVKT